MAPSSKLFDAFFWIEPQRSTPSQSFSSTKILWHYPSDISSICQEFNDIPQFCFPELDVLKIEKAELSRNEHFVFTLTDKDGCRVYGVCLRTFNEGVMRRFDVSRRPKNCLCVISRRPYFTLFRALLLQVHSLALLDRSSAAPLPSAIVFLHHLYLQSDILTPNKHLVVSRNAIPSLLRDVHMVIPRDGAVIHKETPILPLLEILGVDRFMWMMSAALCERRLLFVGDSVSTVSASVLSMVAVLHPFVWPHILIPILPRKLLDYATAPVPFIMGLKKYLLSELLAKKSLEGVVVIDVDTGDCRTYGDVEIKDFVGESGSALKQASESLDRVVARASGVANLLIRSAGAKVAEVQDAGPRDLLVVMLAELRSLMASRPGASSMQAVTELIRTGVGRTSVDSSKDRYPVDGERTVRQMLLLFYAYLFADMDDCCKQGPTVSPFSKPAYEGESPVRAPASKSDARAAFDLQMFVYKRQQAGDSKHILDFLAEFRDSQMFERFCAYRKEAVHNNKASRTASVSSSEDVDDYNIVCVELKYRGLAPTVANVKAVVQRILSVEREASYVGSVNASLVSDIPSSYYHPLTLFATAAGTDVAATDELNAQFNVILRDCFGNSEVMLKVMRTLALRLEEHRAAMKSNSSTKVVCSRVLDLVRYLLIFGPHAFVIELYDVVPIIKSIALEANRLPNSVRDIDIKAKATFIVLLLVDYKLLEQVRLLENSSNPAKNCYPRPVFYSKKNLLAVGRDDRREMRMPDFKMLHMALAPSHAWPPPPSTSLHLQDTLNMARHYTPPKPTKPQAKVPAPFLDLMEDTYSPAPPAASVDLLSMSPIAAQSSRGFGGDPFEGASNPFDNFAVSSPAPVKKGSVNIFDPQSKTAFDSAALDDPFSSVFNPSTGVSARASTSSMAGFDEFELPTSAAVSDPFASILSSATGQEDPFAAVVSTSTDDPFASVINSQPPKPTKPPNF